MAKNKICSKCKESFPMNKEHFYKRSDDHGDGFRQPCIKCRVKTDKKRRKKIGNNIQCTKCMNFYPATDKYFHRKKDTSTGFRSWCKECRKKYSRLGDRVRAFNITLKDYNNMFSKKNGCCWICGLHQKDLDRKLCIDHDHKTGKVRGLLCNSCNSTLGYARDNKLILIRAVKYLGGNLLEQKNL